MQCFKILAIQIDISYMSDVVTLVSGRASTLNIKSYSTCHFKGQIFLIL